jgi:hypothetical protein
VIPKRLIRVWVGDDEPTGVYAECLREQDRMFKDWEHINVTDKNCPIMDAPFLRAAKAQGKPVLQTAIRYWALREYSGCYLDADVMPLRDFSPLMDHDHDMFLGYEQEPGVICEAVIGARKSEAMSRLFWQFPWGCNAEDDIVSYGPPLTTRTIKGMPEHVRNRITVYPKHYFYTHSYGEVPRHQPDSYASHLWAACWVKKVGL